MKLVFVSSTFKDMQSERDLLQTYAVPFLNEKLKEYGERAYFGDLRWGVNTSDLDSEEGSRKVLKVCLDQIDGARPYMIVLIGERYGWIPSGELIREACLLKGIETVEDVSVTELEIDYGALLHPECGGRILFYFRDLDKSGMTEAELRDFEAEAPLHSQKIEALKARIQEIYPDRIRCYHAAWDAKERKVSGLDGFLSLVQEDLARVLSEDLAAENRLPFQVRCMRAARRYFEECGKALVPVDGCERAYVGSEARVRESFLYVFGDGGSGKSSAVMLRYREDTGEKLAFSFGLDKFSRNSLDFARVLLYKLEELLGYAHEEGDDVSEERLLRYLSALEAPLGIYIDNGDRDLFSFLSRLEWAYRNGGEPFPPNARFVIAAQERLPYYPFFELSCGLSVGELSGADARAVLEGIVKSNHKELSQRVKQRILSKKSSRSAAYLKSAVKRLLMLDSEDFAAIRAMGDGMDAIDRYMISLIDATADGREEILFELIGEAKERIDRRFVERLLGLFAHVPVGLSVHDVRGIFAAYGWEFNDLDFSLSVQMLEDVLQYNPNLCLYRIKNQAIRNRVLQTVGIWDAVPAAEYMLRQEELCPYAFRGAVLDGEPQYLCSVLARSGITDIRDGILCLLRQNMKEKAVSLLVAVAENEAFWNVEALPSFASALLGEAPEGERGMYVLEFFGELATACSERLTEDSVLMLEMAMGARLAVAEYALEIDPAVSVDLLIDADALMRRNARRMDVATVNRMYLLMLKAVRKSGSGELFEEYVGGEEYLKVFRCAEGCDGALLKMKVYAEFSEAVAVLDGALEQAYREKAKEIAQEEDLIPREAEDFWYMARLTGDRRLFPLGRALFPLDAELLRREVQAELGDPGANARDTAAKALAMWRFTDALSDCVAYWRAVLYRLTEMRDEGEPLDGELVDIYIAITAHLNGLEICASDYVDILPFAMLLESTEDVERLLKAAQNGGALQGVAQEMIRLYLIEEDRQGLAALRDKFMQMRQRHMGADRIATLFIEEYFDLLTE